MPNPYATPADRVNTSGRDVVGPGLAALFSGAAQGYIKGTESNMEDRAKQEEARVAEKKVNWAMAKTLLDQLAAAGQLDADGLVGGFRAEKAKPGNEKLTLADYAMTGGLKFTGKPGAVFQNAEANLKNADTNAGTLGQKKTSDENQNQHWIRMDATDALEKKRVGGQAAQDLWDNGWKTYHQSLASSLGKFADINAPEPKGMEMMKTIINNAKNQKELADVYDVIVKTPEYQAALKDPLGKGLSIRVEQALALRAHKLGLPPPNLAGGPKPEAPAADGVITLTIGDAKAMYPDMEFSPNDEFTVGTKKYRVK